MSSAASSPPPPLSPKRSAADRSLPVTPKSVVKQAPTFAPAATTPDQHHSHHAVAARSFLETYAEPTGLPPLPHAATAAATAAAAAAAAAAASSTPPVTPSRPAPRTQKTKPWTAEEDEILTKAVKQNQGRNWKRVAEFLPGRTHSQAAHRWQKVLDPSLKKGPWTSEEDAQLQRAVGAIGEGHWSRVADQVATRNGKQCRERWRNQISPTVDKRPWSEEEDARIIRLYEEHGPKWAKIAEHMPGRTENAVKNRWNARLSRPSARSESSGASPSPPKRQRTDKKLRVKKSKRDEQQLDAAQALNALRASPGVVGW